MATLKRTEDPCAPTRATKVSVWIVARGDFRSRFFVRRRSDRTDRQECLFEAIGNALKQRRLCSLTILA